MNYAKVIKTVVDITKHLTPESYQKANSFFIKNGKQFQQAINENTDEIVGAIDSASQKVKENTPVLCEMLSTEKVDLAVLKSIIKNTMIEGSKFVAVLNMGRNPKDKIQLFMQYLDGNHVAVETDKIFCIECDMIAEDMKSAFGNKEMILINL